MPGRDIFMKTAQENVMHSNIRQMKVYCHNRRITRHGFPTATQFSGMERVTTLPAPMTLFLPIVTPGRRIAPPPIQTPSSIVTGLDTVDNSQINVLTQRTMHRICTAATNEEVSFAYRVAIPRQRFRWRNAFSTRWRSL